MKIAIYGAGSLGTVLGAFLTEGGIEIDLINHNTSHIAALKKNGAHIAGTVDIRIPVRAFLPEEITGPYDIIFLMTKQLDNANVVGKLVKFLSPEGVICTMQNGLPELSISHVIGKDRTFGCAIAWGASMTQNGICELTSEPGSLTFGLGSFGNNPKMLNEIKKVLEIMGPVEVESNFIGARWSKLLVNCAFSGMSTVLGCNFGEVVDNKKARLCAQRIIKECIDVAKKAEIKIEPIQGKNISALLDYHTTLKKMFSFAIIPLAIKKHRLIRGSMLQDLEKGKKCEIDSINGVVCEYGKKVFVATPYNSRVVEVIHQIENGTSRPCIENLHFFEDL